MGMPVWGCSSCGFLSTLFGLGIVAKLVSCTVFVGSATVLDWLEVLKEFCKREFRKLKLWQGRKVEQGFYKFQVSSLKAGAIPSEAQRKGA
jgi:hypothetical protein